MHANTVDSCVLIVAQCMAVLSSGGVCIVTCDVYSVAGAQILRVPVCIFSYIAVHVQNRRILYYTKWLSDSPIITQVHAFIYHRRVFKTNGFGKCLQVYSVPGEGI